MPSKEVEPRIGILLRGRSQPAVAAVDQLVVRVLHPHDRHLLGAGLVDQCADVGDDRVAFVGVADDVLAVPWWRVL